MLVTAAFDGGCEVTLVELQELFPEEEGTLERLAKIRDLLLKWSLELVPGLDRGGERLPRILRRGGNSQAMNVDFRSEIAEGETDFQEFKESLVFNSKYASQNPREDPSKYRSEDVLFSSLKSICAFLNTDGGVLYVGVDDCGRPRCLSADGVCLGHGGFDRDKWELALRNYLMGSFKDGGTINDYVRASFFQDSGSWIARLEVTRRKQLSFVRRRSGAPLQLFRRQGNRTLEVQIDEVEEFLARRAPE